MTTTQHHHESISEQSLERTILFSTFMIIHAIYATGGHDWFALFHAVLAFVTVVMPQSDTTDDSSTTPISSKNE